ncbi:MAG TPA: alpha-1,4-glucan--maltose-1-phosphate maltosyltransferase [Gemmatimonadaceae bacterium]|nr:alpha-1,4-glucan--maltose-1-phosphate maltosyltransferase [Gemmatimonadaceae bacterium]
MPERNTDRRSPTRGLDHLTIECVTPELDNGRYPVKRVVGDVVRVGADVIKEGHDLVAAHIVVRSPSEPAWQLPMQYDFNTDRWYGEFSVDQVGRWHYTVEAWTDVWETWRTGFRKKVDAGQNTRIELLEAAQYVRAAARRAARGPVRASLTQTARAFESIEDLPEDVVVRRALDPELAALMREHFLPRDLTRYVRELAVVVDRARARFAGWYEFFPRSSDPTGKHGTFRTAIDALPRIAGLGFDVLYLPPIHPVGRTFRKGRNNTLTPEPDDVGSPWAIGNEHGGHDAIEPALGTLDDFDAFVAAARELNLEVALDYALQCSPDHPWVKEHPDWFNQRPDGTIAYAENPPKKYQDIYPLNFWCADRRNLWEACRDIVAHWIAHGVKTFRVDNPHTKPLAFWEWLIADIQSAHPDVIFFAEAFTRPKRMKNLAKLGFTMSYTYFTWKNTAWELRDYLTELTTPPVSEYYRGNLFVNTPDILTDYLVQGGRPAFRARLVLAATLSPLYGMYSGYELIENVPLRAGSEEYLHSEKYQVRVRDWNAEGNINADVALMNRLRRETPALQRYANLTFHASENEQIVFYRKAGRESVVGRGSRVAGAATNDLRPATAVVPAQKLAPLEPKFADPDILVAVNLDPMNVQATMVHVPVEHMGLGVDEPYVVHDLISGARFTWRGERNYVRLDPNDQVAHVLRVERE